MSNVNDYEQEPQSPDEPPAPTPRGGGDLSGKGISGSSGEDEGDEAGRDEATTGSNS